MRHEGGGGGVRIRGLGIINPSDSIAVKDQF
jgi:hypothetical protein